MKLFMCFLDLTFHQARASRESGLVKKIALSTHGTETLKQVLNYPEIDIVCAPINKIGTYIDDGVQQERLDVLRALYGAGKGVYVIKVLRAGRFRDQAETCIKYVLGYRDFIDAWNIGMYDLEDDIRNKAIFDEVLK